MTSSKYKSGQHAPVVGPNRALLETNPESCDKDKHVDGHESPNDAKNDRAGVLIGRQLLWQG